MNPSIAAKSLLTSGFGRSRVKRAIQEYARRRRASRPGNPDLSSVASLIPGGGIASKLLGVKPARFQSPAQRQAARQAVADQLAQRAALGDAAALAELTRLTTAFATKGGRDYASLKLAEVRAGRGGAPASPLAQFGQVLASPTGAGLVRTVAAAVKPKRARRGRYPTYVDRQGRQRYSTKPPGGELRLPAGATPTPGTPYSFFQGAVGKGGAAKTAGQFAVAAAVGVGVYLVTRKLLQYLGGGAQRKEEAGVNAARALHEALEEYKAQKGAYPPPAERAQMKAAYRDKLVELGYDPDTFTRTRSGFENFLEDYNPFGG